MEKGIVLIIPAYNPDEKFINFVKDLTNDGWKDIIVIDDGSREQSQPFLEESAEKYGCQLVRHYTNLGQGRAFKTAFNYFIGKYGTDPDVVGVVECDCDGQHTLKDVNNCAKMLKENPDRFILGVRDFNAKGIPLRSRLGNKITGFVFKFFCGLDINDTQTGLKGIPTDFVYDLIEVPGERFEYASSVLLATKDYHVDILQLPISTIYLDGNATSHFNPIRDSIRIYSLIFNYMRCSFWAVLLEFITFAIIVNHAGAGSITVIVAGITAKLFSGSVRYLSFNRRPIKFVICCMIHTAISTALIILTSDTIQLNTLSAKILVELSLYIITYLVRGMIKKLNRKV